jgi:GGDEF domain-containing protein
MTTLTPFMNASRTVAAERKAEALSRVVSMLLQGIALHCPETDSVDAADFQTAIRKVRSDFERVEDQDSTLLLAGAAIRLMEDYNGGVSLHARAKQNHLEAAVAQLSEALLDVAHASEATMVAFKELERDLASATSVEALRIAREKLESAIAAIQEEAAHPLKKCGVPSGETDVATRLPDYGFAAAAIADIWSRRHDYFAVIFAAERLETINMRFGFPAGDQVLHLLSQTVAKALSPADRLFRWRGPCIMALVKRDAPEAFVAGDMARLTMTKMEHAITLGDREVMLSVSASWNLFPLRAASDIEDLLGRMNTFAAGRLPARREAVASRARA